jgi:glycosyltransferase involved in cell wall biosynthesis
MRKEKDTPKIQKRINVQKGKEPELTVIQHGFWNLNPKGVVESINRISVPWLYDVLNKRNNRIFARAIGSAIARLDFKNIILFNDSSMFLGLYLKELLNPAVYVYYMRDYLTKNPYWRKQGVRLEPELIRKSDVVVNNSTLYAEYGKQFNPHSYMVGQGCDVSLFNDVERTIVPAADISGIERPIIGYVGSMMSRRLDIKLIGDIARERPKWSIVLVGPEDDPFKSSDLHSIPNVHFIGSRDPMVLPDYIKGFDVCINPQLINDATRGNYPRKIDEYLAMGKPVVATATEAMEYFKDHTYLAKDKEGYLRAIEQALQEDNAQRQQQRRHYALSHTWENNVAEIYRCIEKVTTGTTT